MNSKSNTPLVQKQEWISLKNHFAKIKNIPLTSLFEKDLKRADNFKIEINNLYYDFSKNILTSKTIDLLTNLTEACHLEKEINRMFSGEKINYTENRAVLHTALRRELTSPLIYQQKNIMTGVANNLKKMKALSDSLRNKKYLGYKNKPIKNIVSLGIGGSNLGPKMVTEALKSYQAKHLKFFFVSNVDPLELDDTLQNLKPAETIFIISSKTFTTQETMANAKTAKEWFIKKSHSKNYFQKHFIGITTNKSLARQFGLIEKNIFPMEDWVGGRYSLASSIGLPIMISIGSKNFLDLLAGLREIDKHFQSTNFTKNIPVLMGLIGIWYNNFFKFESQAILPYSSRLHLFPAFLQQLDMESNGKNVDKHQNKITYQTGPIIWGGTGSDVQHSFFQLLHQGTKIIPADFIGFIKSSSKNEEQHLQLMSNFFAQPEALAFGGSLGKDNDPLNNYKKFYGNRPSSTMLFHELSPQALGNLIALYEHKIFVQGIIWKIFSFDQWGVELGKNIAKKILKNLKNEKTNVSISKKVLHSSLIKKFTKERGL